jgi:hypothetical protein
MGLIIYHVIKFSYLLYITYKKPTNIVIDELFWWVCLLIFDIWLLLNIPQPKD